jgi:metal-responsive CopG/Arc/MetJ family transcriptional regulator
MRTAKITISMSQELLQNLDGLVQSHTFASRSQAVQEAVQEKIGRLNKTRLARECAKLDPVEEQAFADLGIESEAGQWPPY